jgi:hypothetical protein
MARKKDAATAKSPLENLEPQRDATSANADPVMDEFRALVLPSSQLPADAATEKALGLPEGVTLGDALKSFIKNLTDGLSRAADDLASLEVRTFGTSDLSKVEYDYAAREFKGELQLRALTRIAFDGDMQVVVPEKNGELNQPMWEAHLAMVREAQANRAAFLGSMAEMAARLIQMFK